MTENEPSVDSASLESTKRQIRGLVNEIAQLAKSDLEPASFYPEFLQRIVSAIAAVGGAIWLRSESGQLEMAYQISISESLLNQDSEESQAHSHLLEGVSQLEEGKLIPPLSGDGSSNTPGNPTRYLLVVHPLRSDDVCEGVLEIFQRPEIQPATQRGHLKFVSNMCDIAVQWLKTQRLRQFSDRQSLWAQVDQFSRLVHESLDKRVTAFTICNEGRRLIGCDRVSIAINKGRRCNIEAISGQDLVEARSNVVTSLRKLSDAVIRADEPLWYDGATGDLPPQIEEALHAYVEESYVRWLAILPLHHIRNNQNRLDDRQDDSDDDDSNFNGEVIGALIVEQIESNVPHEILSSRIDMVQQYGARALTNALDHSNLFLMPLWRALGNATWVLRARTLPKTLAVLGVVVILLLSMALIPAPFKLEARGTVEPENKRDVFVGVNGVVTKVFPKHGQDVVKGEVLVKLRNIDLEVQITDLEGQQNATHEQLQAVSRSRLDDTRLAADERARLTGQSLQLLERLASLNRQLDLLHAKKDRLEVRSPISGQVVTWDVENLLINRPVTQGEVLLSVVDTTSSWQLELRMPENRVGHLNRRRSELADKPMRVSYILATDPSRRHWGEVVEIQRVSMLDEQAGNSVRVRVKLDKDDLPDLRPGATVIADVQCGTRSIGYVWFHQAFEAFERFRFSMF